MITSIVTTIITLVVLAFLVIVAFWRNDRMFYFLAGFGWGWYGFTLYGTLEYVSILLVVAGVYCIARGIWAT